MVRIKGYDKGRDAKVKEEMRSPPALWSETPATVAFFTSRILNHLKKDTFHIYLQYYCDTMPDCVILQKYIMPVLIVLVYTLS